MERRKNQPQKRRQNWLSQSHSLVLRATAIKKSIHSILEELLLLLFPLLSLMLYSMSLLHWLHLSLSWSTFLLTRTLLLLLLLSDVLLLGDVLLLSDLLLLQLEDEESSGDEPLEQHGLLQLLPSSSLAAKAAALVFFE